MKEALTAEAEKNGIPVAFYADQVKSGGMFNKKIEDCIVMYHPEHRNDYFLFCTRVQQEGSLAFVAVNDFGASKQMDKFARAAKSDRACAKGNGQVLSVWKCQPLWMAIQRRSYESR